jgi:hypothetical protein
MAEPPFNMGILYPKNATRCKVSATRCAYVVTLCQGVNKNHSHLGGGNETHSHLERPRSPTRTTLGNLRNQEGAIKDLPKAQRLYPNSKKLLDNF